MNPTAEGNDHRPASSGESPSTSCRYCATNRKYPNAMKMPSTFVVSAALNARFRNSPRSIIGSSSDRCRRTNTTPSTAPMTIVTIGRRSMPSWAICFSPKITDRIATSEIAALVRSSRPAFGSRNSGSSLGPSTSSSAITGTANRKTEPHQKCSSSSPPATGPTALPAENPAIHTPTAIVR